MTATATRVPPARLCMRAAEFRATDDGAGHGDGRTLEGYAAVFNTPTRIEEWFYSYDEQIAPGAFKRSIANRKPVMQFNHGMDSRTGSLPIGSVETLSEDDKGLQVRARLFDNDLVDPIREAISAGAVDGMSFRFRVIRESWADVNGQKITDNDELFDLLLDEHSDRTPLMRTLEQVDLLELGPVVFPAYEATSVGVRSMLEHLGIDERRKLLADLSASYSATRSGDDADDEQDLPAEDSAPAADGTAEPDADENTEPGDTATSEGEHAGPGENATPAAEPARSHSAYLGDPGASWYLPPRTA